MRTSRVGAALALVLVLALGACSDVADDELRADQVCENSPPAIFEVSAVADERGVGVAWTEPAWLLEETKSYSVYRRAADSPDSEWLSVTDVSLAPHTPREAVPLDLPPGRWDVGVTFHDPECGESPICAGRACVSVELAVEASGTRSGG